MTYKQILRKVNSIIVYYAALRRTLIPELEKNIKNSIFLGMEYFTLSITKFQETETPKRKT